MAGRVTRLAALLTLVVLLVAGCPKAPDDPAPQDDRGVRRLVSRLPTLVELPEKSGVNYAVLGAEGPTSDHPRSTGCGQYPELGNTEGPAVQGEYLDGAHPMRTAVQVGLRMAKPGEDVAAELSLAGSTFPAPPGYGRARSNSPDPWPRADCAPPAQPSGSRAPW